MQHLKQSATGLSILSLFFLFLGLNSSFLSAQTPEITLQKGAVITQSCRVKAETYLLSGDPKDVFLTQAPLHTIRPVLTITGNDVTVDFQGAELRGAATEVLPNTFYGVAIVLKGRNITLKNARIRGFKIAILADSTQGLALDNCDVSYNYRPKLYSGREHEAFSDWLSYHQNERDEWLRYGAGIYLRHSTGFTVSNCRATGNQNALLMHHCMGGLITNNIFQFNSGLGIGLYRSSDNRIMHNKLDWNVRGYSHGFYQRGQDSAGILVYEQSHRNLIAFNNATHSGDGLFLWAGQTTMDTGQGGCNDNWIYGNDFSCAPTNGVEVTFSRNRIQGNRIEECTYGIWGGYSYETVIQGNLIGMCETAIAIEHGQQDTILQNLFDRNKTGIKLWARPTQPADWGYSKNRDVRSRQHLIDRNVFHKVRKPLHISVSQKVSINGENLFTDFETLLEAPAPNDSLRFLRNDLYAPMATLESTWATPELTRWRGVNFNHANQQPQDLYAPLMAQAISLKEPDSLKGHIETGLPEGFPKGRPFIIMGPWGPFDFKRPIAMLDTVADNRYSIALIGPPGDWKIVTMRGVKTISKRSGTLPTVLEIEREATTDDVLVVFEYSGQRTVTDVLGEKVPPGRPYRFSFARFDKKMAWETQFFNAATPGDSLSNAAVFAKAIQQKPVAVKTNDVLWYTWWGAPAEGVSADQFATVSRSSVVLAPGQYHISLTSDDGARLYIDGKKVIDHWQPHEAATDEITLTLGGRHTFTVEHYDAGGFSTVDFRMGRVE
jgi:parallel beta-helix repeat protein